MRLKPQQIEDWVIKNFQYKRKKNGDELKICNPDGDTKYNLSICTNYKTLKNRTDKSGKPVSGFWVNDFRVNHQQYNGSFINFVMKYKNMSYFEAMQDVTGQDKKTLRGLMRSLPIPKHEEIKEEEPEEPLVELPKSFLFEDGEDTRSKFMALNYLYSRAITENVIIKHTLRYTATSIVFPYIEYGEPVFWQRRSFLDKSFEFPDQEKTGLHKTDYLYGFDDIEQPCEYAIIVESIFNKLSVGDSCLATGGAKMTDGSKQIQRLRALNPGLVILAPDLDAAGLKSLRHNYFLLKKDFKNLAYAIPPEKDIDWNDMDQRDGVGSAFNYIEKNTKRLNLLALSKLFDTK